MKRVPSAEAPVLLIGASSDIGVRLAHEFARAGHPLYLTTRDPDKLAPVGADLQIRYAVPVRIFPLDVLAPKTARQTVQELQPVPHIAICLVGLLGEQRAQELDPAQAQLVVETNFLGPAVVLEAVAQSMATVDAPTTIVGVSSVAGDRGRARNYYYGAAKAGFTTFLSGLRQRLARSRTTVITVKPGFVATRMTTAMELPPALTASDAECARLIKQAVDRGQLIVYPWKWRIIMGVVRFIPERLFRKLRF
ncbi:MAG: SDR family oxidoreductase [Steroidobacteraceae bacterium]